MARQGRAVGKRLPGRLHPAALGVNWQFWVVVACPRAGMCGSFITSHQPALAGMLLLTCSRRPPAQGFGSGGCVVSRSC